MSLTQHLEQRQFDDTLTVFGLANHVDFPTHISVFSIDLAITELSSNMVNYRPLVTVGSSDHLTVLAKIKLTIVRVQGVNCTSWLWDKGNGDAIRTALNNTVWSDVLLRDVATQIRNVTETLLSYQRRFVPS